jgi:hypothetical protein
MALLVGLAILSVVVCLLAWLRIFGRFSMAALSVLAAGVSLRFAIVDAANWRARWRAAPRPGGVVITCFALLLLVLLGFSALTLYPSTAFDATSYHLPLARDLVQHHGLVYDPFVRYSFFPQSNEALFAVMLLLSPTPAASAALEFCVLALAAILMPLWFLGAGRRVGAGLVGALVLLASPVVIYAGTAAFVDTWTLAFVLAALLLGLDVAERRGRTLPALALVGVLLGEAAATKYTGAAFGLAALVGVLVAVGPSRAVWRALPATLGGFAAIALPWYAWTLHTTGDPLYPFATGLFGNRHGLWTAAEIRFQSVVARGFARSGIGGILSRDLRYLRGAIPYDTGVHRSPLSWWLGSGFLGLLNRSAWRDRTFIGTTVAAALSIGLSLVISADPRYLVPGLGPLALCAGLAAGQALDASAHLLGGRLQARRVAPLWSVLAVVVVLWSSGSYALDFRSANGSPPTASGKVYSYLAARIPCYSAVSYLNGHVGSHYRAWGYSCEQAHYYAHGRLIGDQFSIGSRPRIFDANGTALPSDQSLWRRLAPLSVQWAILPVQYVPAPARLEAHGLFTLVSSVGPMDVFRVASAPSKAGAVPGP